MRHLHSHPLHEARRGTPVGWVLSESGVLWAGAAPTFWAFAAGVWRDKTDESGVRIYDVEHLNGLFEDNEMADWQEESECHFDLWWGFTPKRRGEWVEELRFSNPYQACTWLEDLLVNPEPVLRSSPYGQQTNPAYLAASLAADPSAASWWRGYAEHEGADHKIEDVLALVPPAQRRPIQVLLGLGDTLDLI